jgi:hypothetical protein
MIDPKVQSFNGVLLLQKNNAWSGDFSYAKLFSWNKARRLCDKMNKCSKKHGKSMGKPYSIYHPIPLCL